MSLPSPIPSSPGLFETIVRFLTPDLCTASIKCSGMPQTPKPPEQIIMPSHKQSCSANEASVKIGLVMNSFSSDWHSKRSRPHTLQDGDTIRHRATAHIEDQPQEGIGQLHLAGTTRELARRENVHGYAGCT